MIDRWLDEGDRLSESMPSSPHLPAQKRRRLAEGLAALGALADRRRFTVVIVAVGVAALAVVGMRAASHAVLRTDPAVAAETPQPQPAPPTASRPPSANPTAPLAAAVGEPTPAAAPRSAAAASPPESEPMPARAVPPAVVAQAEPVAAARAPAPPEPEAQPQAARPSSREAPATRPPPAPHPLGAAAEPELPAAPAPAPAPRASSSSNSMEECQAALRRERAKPALVACEKVLRDNPASADAMVLLAHANLLAGADGETLRLARRASFLDPKCADAYLLVGTVLQTQGRAPAARSAYQSYLQNAPHGSHAAEVRAILKTL